jgi:hypothetical protein
MGGPTYYYLFPETIGLKNPDPMAFRQIGRSIEQWMNRSICDMNIIVRTDLNHKHKTSGSEFLDEDAKLAYKDILESKKRDFTFVLGKILNCESLSKGARYVLEKLLDKNKKSAVVTTVKRCLNDLRDDEWLATLDKTLATEKAVHEVHKYIKEFRTFPHWSWPDQRQWLGKRRSWFLRQPRTTKERRIKCLRRKRSSNNSQKSKEGAS